MKMQCPYKNCEGDLKKVNKGDIWDYEYCNVCDTLFVLNNEDQWEISEENYLENDNR